jgi:hypothetical protein
MLLRVIVVDILTGQGKLMPNKPLHRIGSDQMSCNISVCSICSSGIASWNSNSELLLGHRLLLQCG